MALQIADTIWLMDPVKGVSIGSPRDLANQGILEDFFVRKGIRFDKENLLFHIDKL